MSLIAAVASLLLVAPTFGELPLRVRGTIIARDDRHITVKERDGRVFQLNTSPTTKYAKVVASNLGAIKLNTYIGSAIKGSLDASTAIEIAIVPQSMRPGRTGYYPWDPLPDISRIPHCATPSLLRPPRSRKPT